MSITDAKISAAHKELKGKHGGAPNDYFGLLYLEAIVGLDREQALEQVAFGGSSTGIDGFHVDAKKKTLHLFIFRNTKNADTFRPAFEQLLGGGLEHIFSNASADDALTKRLRRSLKEDRDSIDRVQFQFVFLGDPAEAERQVHHPQQHRGKILVLQDRKKQLAEDIFAHPEKLSLFQRDELAFLLE